MPEPAIRLLISSRLVVGALAIADKSSMLFSERTLSGAFADLELFLLRTASMTCLTEDAAVAPAFATLPATLATLDIVSLFAATNLPAAPMACTTGRIQSNRPLPITKRRRLLALRRGVPSYINIFVLLFTPRDIFK